MRGKGDLGRIRKEVGRQLLVEAELMFGSVCKREREPRGNRGLVFHLRANWIKGGYAGSRGRSQLRQEDGGGTAKKQRYEISARHS